MINKEIPQLAKTTPENSENDKMLYREAVLFYTEQNDLDAFPFTQEEYDAMTPEKFEDAMDAFMQERSAANRQVDQNIQPDIKVSQEDFSTFRKNRRLVLKGVAAGALAASVPLPDNKLVNLEKGLEWDEIPSKETYEHLPDADIFRVIEKIKEYPDGGMIPREQIASGKDQITLDKATQRALFEYWHERLSPSGNLHNDVRIAIERLEYWDEESKAMFAREGMPPCLRKLAIIESTGDIEAESSAGARGILQFTAEAAQRFDLPYVEDVNKNVILVSAYDPIESSRAGAEHLAQSYEDYNHNWWNALSDYNGGYTNHYKKVHGALRDEQELLSWREKNINKLLAKELQNTPTEKRVDIFRRLSLEENIDYPAKYFALLAVLDEMGIMKEKDTKEMTEPELPYKYAKITEPDGYNHLPTHTIVKGDSIDRIADKFIKALREKRVLLPYTLSKRIIGSIIKVQNNISNPRAIQIGQKINFSYPSKYSDIPSLEEVARICNCSIESLRKNNPAVRNTKAPLVPGYYPRIPI